MNALVAFGGLGLICGALYVTAVALSIGAVDDPYADFDEDDDDGVA